MLRAYCLYQDFVIAKTAWDQQQKKHRGKVERNTSVATEDQRDKSGRSSSLVAGCAYSRGCLCVWGAPWAKAGAGAGPAGGQPSPEDLPLPFTPHVPAALAAAGAEVVPGKRGPEPLWPHPHLPCGDSTCQGEVAAVDACDNAEYRL